MWQAGLLEPHLPKENVARTENSEFTDLVDFYKIKDLVDSDLLHLPDIPVIPYLVDPLDLP